jgi:geranylgeranyl diphosphate synthase, type II
MGHAHDAPFIGTDDALVQEVLSEYGTMTRLHLQTYLPQEEPNSYLYGLLADYPARGGKMLRSSLCISMARAVGGPIEDAMACAVSIELMHNALLVHDDIEDDSDERRGTPTLHALHGIPLAINAGDAMGLLSLRPLKENFHRLGIATAMRIFEETERMAWESAEGQALELGWQRDNRTDISDEDYLHMVLQKTCWLMAIHPLRVGCLIGARGRLPLDPLIRIGFFFGAAFQIRDDLLNLEGGPAYGKEINGDLLEGKRTLMLIHAFRHADHRKRLRLTEFLATPRRMRTERDVAWVHGLLARTGAIAHASTVAQSLGGAALYEFDRYFADVPAGRDLRFMRALLTWVMQRTH